MAPSKQHEYTPIAYPSEDKDSEVSLLSDHSEDGSFPQSKVPQWLAQPMLILPWFLTAIFATSSVILLSMRLSSNGRCGYNPVNEFIDPATIPLEDVRFSGSPQFYPNGSLMHKHIDESAPWPENLQYFGEPSPEIDANWERLIGWRYFSISEDEAKSVWSDTYHEYVDELKGGYTAGLDVFHNLHCVNAVRKALRPDYYQKKPASDDLHIGHCLDILRQHVQCSGSTTLIPTRFMDGIKRNYIDSDQVHTCRSFTFLRDWTTSRRVGGDAYVERDSSIVDPRKHALAEEKLAHIVAELGSP